VEHLCGYGRDVDVVSGVEVPGNEVPGNEASRVLERIRRIRLLDREQVPASRLLGELRELVAEAEAWARLEGDERAAAAAARLAESVSNREEVPLEIASAH
jgi:hypothetical protein